MKTEKLKKTVSAALFMAIICVATYVVQIPIPATGGYANLGDCFVLTAGYILGAGYGAVAAGLGSALADILAGYVQYAPATFVIKALVAVSAYFIFIAVDKAISKKYSVISRIISSTVSESFMIIGYFIYEALILGYGKAAVGSIIPNTVQGIFAVITSVIISTAISKIRINNLNKG